MPRSIESERNLGVRVGSQALSLTDSQILQILHLPNVVLLFDSQMGSIVLVHQPYKSELLPFFLQIFPLNMSLGVRIAAIFLADFCL